MTSEFGFLNVLAGLAVTDIDESIAWYSRLFGRGPDMEPVPGIAEWVLTSGGIVQLVNRPATAGRGFARLEVADLDQSVRILQDRGLAPAEVGEIEDVIRFADYTDPSGNEISIVEALFDVVRFGSPRAD